VKSELNVGCEEALLSNGGSGVAKKSTKFDDMNTKNDDKL